MRDVTAAGRPLRILVVENDDDTRRVMAMYLARKGHAVGTVASLGEAVDRLAGEVADLLIVDIGLPDGNGWELLDRLRANGIAVPPYAIAMTGFGHSDDVDKSRAAGFRHHLVKPFDPSKLLAILDEARGEAGGAA